jgi:glycosyltransferase involved in cell wall biosynthesis
MIRGKVNIIVPLYNQEQYIVECLRSVIVQSFRNFTVTVVNDGSTDNSASIVADFMSAHDPLHKIQLVTQSNQGLSAARNAGILLSAGEFILPLDSDDYIDSDYLERTVPRMDDRNVGIVATDMSYFGIRHETVPPSGITLEREMVGNGLPVCSLIRRTAFEETGGYEPLTIFAEGKTFAPGYEDWSLWLSILKNGWTVSIVNEPLFHYRTKPVSMVTKCQNYDTLLREALQRRHPDLFGERVS